MRPDVDGQIALVVQLRMTKHTGGLDELLVGRSSMRGEVLVLLPDDVRDAELVLRDYDDSRTLPFTIVPVAG